MRVAENVQSPHLREVPAVVLPGAARRDPPRRDAGDGDYLDLAALLRAARRQSLVVAACVAVALGLAAVHIATAPPVYTAYATVLLDQERAELRDLVSAMPSAALGDAAVQSEVEVLKSHELALRVVDRLDLTARPDALRMDPTLIGAAVGAARGVAGTLLDSLAPGSEDEAVEPGAVADRNEAERRDLATVLRNNLGVERVGRSYVLDLTYEAPTPLLAAEIATAYTTAYLDFQQEANRSAAGSARVWLERRVERLREQSIATTRALERFRRENGLVSVGGRLLSEQQLSEVMTNLILAEGEAARARSEWTQAAEVADGGVDSALAALGAGAGSDSPSVIDLRADYITTRQRHHDVVEQFGADHPEAQRLGRELERLRTLVVDEVRRRETMARRAYDAVTSRVASLREGLDKALGGQATDEETISSLRQLEHRNETYETLYQEAMTRLERAVQQESVSIVDARVITEPSIPKSQSSPSKARIIAIGLVLGLFAGGGLGLFREMRRDAIETRQDVSDILGLPLLGTLSRRSMRQSMVQSRRRWLAAHPRTVPLEKVDADLLRTLRAVKLAVDEHVQQPGGRTVAFISERPNEGRTTLAVNFAVLLAQYGFSTLLIDADLPGMKAMELLSQEPTTSLTEILENEPQTEASALPQVGSDPLFALPLSPPGSPHLGIIHSGSERMRRQFRAYRTMFDYIVIDGAPASEGRDAEAMSAYADAAILTLRRSKSSATEAREMTGNTKWREKVAGVILNVA